jgi:hypothetical protein
MRTRTQRVHRLQPVQQDDVLDMTLRVLLQRVLGVATTDEWISIRDSNYPWRQLVAAAERGECAVSRVGRKLMMRRDELDRWLAAQRIVPKSQNDAPKNELQDRVAAMLAKQGF